MESEVDEEPGNCHDQGDGIRTSCEQNDNKEEFHLKQSHGSYFASYYLHV